jgi:hypothetical protein
MDSTWRIIAGSCDTQDTIGTIKFNINRKIEPLSRDDHMRKEQQ